MPDVILTIMYDFKSLIIFGDRLMSSLVWHSVILDAGCKVAAFTVDAEWLSKKTHEGLPVAPFEEVADLFSPVTHDILIPIGWSEINGVRKKRCETAKSMGYRLARFVSRHAIVSSGIQIGENCMVFEQAVVQSFVKMGKNVIIRAGANIGHHSIVEDHCFIASGVVTGGNVHIAEQCFIGLGAILRDGIRIAPRCLIGAGAVVIADTEPDGVYVGNPARRLKKTSLEVTLG